jgi:hypothetical protein
MYHNRTKAAVLGSALAGGAALALLAPAAPALAFDSGDLHLDINVESPITLVARGAAIDVPIEIECTSDYASVQVSVTERVGNRIVSGVNYLTVACTGGTQEMVVRVEATNAGRPFGRGTAVVTAYIFGCTSTVCGQESDSDTVRITK